MNQDKLSKPRLFAVFIFFLACLFCLLLRLAYIQLFKSNDYSSIAQDQSRVTIEMQPTRGRILDRSGHELASDVRLDSLYAESRIIKNKPQVAAKIAPILGKSYDEVYRRIKKDKGFVWIARKLPESKSKAIKQLKIVGLGFVKESKRVYPKAELACHLVGFTDVDNNGLEGVEINYNSFLKGVPGWRLGQRDAKQRELISKQAEMVAPVDGFNVHLTIDEVIQSIADKELQATCDKFNALGGAVTVIDPKTGDILAMCTYPTYDLNNARNAKIEYRRNRAITDLFEPGSVFKVFTLSSVLENKVMSVDEKLNCEGGDWAVAGKVLHDVHSYGTISLREVIEKSSNIGTVKSALRLGADKLYKTLKDFGFGVRAGVDLAGEINGILHHPRNWSRSSIINIPIGQGVAITPIQLAMGVAAIANDGVLMKPRIITHIDDNDQHVIQSYPPKEIRRVISKETALQVRSVMEGVVSRGTGKKAIVPGFKAAGKTGTAQKLLPGGGYSHDYFIASFVGFVPYDEPKVVICVSIDQPHPIYYGGDVAAPAFSKIADGIMSYWQIRRNEAPPELVRTGKAGTKRQ